MDFRILISVNYDGHFFIMRELSKKINATYPTLESVFSKDHLIDNEIHLFDIDNNQISIIEFDNLVNILDCIALSNISYAYIHHKDDGTVSFRNRGRLADTFKIDANLFYIHNGNSVGNKTKQSFVNNSQPAPNNHKCKSCGNDRCSKTEKICWRCGNAP